MNGELIKQPDFALDCGAIDGANYAESLFSEGLRLRVADDGDAQRFVGEVAALLKSAIELASGGESTSVKSENAERMIRSIIYVVDTALKAQPTPELALGRLLSDGAGRLYYEGLHILNSLKKKADLLRLLLLRTKLADQSDHYYKFSDITVPRYISGYEPKFDARSSVWIELPELGVTGSVSGLTDFYALMRRLFEYNTSG